MAAEEASVSNGALNLGTRSQLKITRVEPFFVDRFLFAEVHTDAGIVGIGESGAWGHLEASSAAISKFARYLVGKDPSCIEHHWNVMHRASHFRGTAIMGAISAIDVALWDIKGKMLDAPVHALLGGMVRDRARVYGHVKAQTIEEMVDKCLEIKARGFTAIGHLNPFLDEDEGEPYFRSFARKISDAVNNVRLLREAVGTDVDLCIELHRRLTPAEAIVFANSIEPYHPMFIEDPIRPDNFDAMAEIASRTSIPVATGERFASLFEFQMLVARSGVKYLRPCLAVCGGITACKKIAAVAEANHLELVPHNPLSPVTLSASLQIAACIPNFAIQEYPTSSASWRQEGSFQLRGAELVDTLPHFANGFVAIPNAAGLGIALRPGVREAFPPVERPIEMRPHVDGSMVEQ